PIYTLSLHDALPISFRMALPLYFPQATASGLVGSAPWVAGRRAQRSSSMYRSGGPTCDVEAYPHHDPPAELKQPSSRMVMAACRDRKSTRLNSSHVA